MSRASTSVLLQYLRKLVSEPATRGLSDCELLARFADEHDESAFAILVRRHGPMVLRVCQRLLANEHDAEDAFQATFLVLASKSASRYWRASVASWLHRVAYHLAMKAKSAAARRTIHERHVVQRRAADPLDTLTGRELLAVLDEELTRLPEKYRSPLVLCYLEGATRDQAAQQLGCPLGTLKHRLEQGRALLRQRLVRRGLPLAVLGAGVLGTEEAVQAAVPPRLAQSTVQSALRIGLGKAAPAVLVSSRAAGLAEEALKGMFLSKLKIGLATVLAVCIASAGFGLAWQREPAAAPGEEKSSEPDREPIQGPGERAEPASVQHRFDHYGDALPADAITRLGTSRFWCMGGFEVAFTPDGSQIVVTSSSEGVFVYDATTGKRLHHLRNPSTNDYGNCMSMPSQGKQLALGLGVGNHNGNAIQIWDLKSGQLLRHFRDAGDEWDRRVTISPNGKMLATYLFFSKTVFLSDAATGNEIYRWSLDHGRDLTNGADSGFAALTFSPDSSTLLVGDGRTIHFWDTTTGTEVRRIENHPGHSVYRLRLAPDGNVLATQGLTDAPKFAQTYDRENTVHLWDTSTGQHLHQISDPSSFNYFQFSPDAKILVTGSGAGMLRIWDVATGKEVHRWSTSGWITTFAFAPDGKKLAILGGTRVRFWDVATGKELSEHTSLPQNVFLLATSPDGRTVASVAWNSDVQLWDARTGQRQQCVTGAKATTLHFSHDGQTLTTLDWDGRARDWDIATGKELRQVLAPAEGRARGQLSHAISPDGKTWASGWKEDLFLWNAATGQKRQVCPGHVGLIGALDFSPDSRTLYCYSLWGNQLSDRKVTCWDVATGKKLRDFAAGTEPSVLPGGFSPDGKWFVRGGHEPRFYLHDMSTGAEVRRIEIPAMRLLDRRVAFSPDSHTLAVGDEEGTIYLLEVASGRFRQRLVGGHEGGITALVFTSDGKRLISGSTDTTAVVWDLTGRLHASGKPPSPVDLDACWADLAGENAERAYESIRLLAASPAQAVPYLAERLHPVHPADDKCLADLIADLTSNQFRVRDRAAGELEKLGELAIPACRVALEGQPSPDARRRLEALIAKQLQERHNPSLLSLQALRALEVLELTGNVPARQQLERLAKGAAQARFTQEAKESLERLAKVFVRD